MKCQGAAKRSKADSPDVEALGLDSEPSTQPPSEAPSGRGYRDGVQEPACAGALSVEAGCSSYDHEGLAECGGMVEDRVGTQRFVEGTEPLGNACSSPDRLTTVLHRCASSTTPT